MNVGALAIMMVFGIPIIFMLGIFSIVILNILMGRKKERAQELNGEETRLIQEIHNGLSKLEKRIETLETIILDRTRKD